MLVVGYFLVIELMKMGPILVEDVVRQSTVVHQCIFTGLDALGDSGNVAGFQHVVEGAIGFSSFVMAPLVQAEQKYFLFSGEVPEGEIGETFGGFPFKIVGFFPAEVFFQGPGQFIVLGQLFLRIFING